MTRARWTRVVVILTVLLPYTLMIAILATIAESVIRDPGDWRADPWTEFGYLGYRMQGVRWWMQYFGGSVLFVALQVLYLLPLRFRPPEAGQRGRPLALSMVIAGLVAAALGTALLSSAVHFLAIVTEQPDGEIDLPGPFRALYVVPIAGIVFGWPLWSLLLFHFVRGVWADRVLSRITRAFFLGTAVEFLFVLPVDVLARRRTGCYCDTLSYAAICLWTGVVFFLAGPGVLIPVLARRTRAMRRGYCAACGYPRAAVPGDVCPECGHAERPQREPPVECPESESEPAPERETPPGEPDGVSSTKGG